MRFTRLRLNGFKSFVDPTDLLIQDGLTGVVGPNGCGKSNLLEALRWVMGENRPTAMRGSGMEDVVFAGTGTRPARAFAEVTLTLDNSDRRAPAGFNDSDQMEVTRRLTRDAGSAYRLNGKELRARDVQMLFADASTGAHSPALVRQGQISELINARPRARRRVLEEAAGISGLYQRRHEAELRLSATEANLARVGDTVEALSAQLATLARQARQAARYREIGADLRRAEAQLLCRRHQDAQAQALERRTELTRAATAAATAERDARAAAAARTQAEQALPPLREEETIAGAVLQRLLVEREALRAEADRARRMIEDLSAQGTQLRRDADRETALAADAGETMARLAEERTTLLAAGDGHDAKLAAAGAESAQAQAALEGLETQLAGETEALAQLSAREKSLSQQLDEARARQRRTLDAETRARADAEREGKRLAAARAAQAEALAAQQAARSDLERAEQALTSSEAALNEARQAQDAARHTRAEAEGTSSTLAAEARALERLLQQSAPDGAPVLDQLRVVPGLERALGAALGDDLQAPLSVSDGSGWQTLPVLDPVPPLPVDVPALSGQVQGPAALERRLSQVGLVDAAQAAGLHRALAPGQRLVTAEGDLWRWDGLVRRAGDGAGDAGVLRLQQKNRLDALQGALEQAQASTARAVAAHEQANRILAQAQAADRAARDARRTAESRSSEATRQASRAEAEAVQAESQGAAAQAQAERLAGEVRAAARRLADAESALAGLDDLAAARGALTALRGQVEAARARVLACRSASEALRRDGEVRARRLADIDREQAGWQQRADSAAERVADLQGRAAQADAALAEARAAPDRIAAQAEVLAERITAAEARRTAASEALSVAESALRAAQGAERETEREAGAAREARAVAQAHADAADQAARLAEEEITAAHDTSAAQLMDRLGIDPDSLPALAVLEPEIARLKRARDALGAVNLRAEEDARALSAEHDVLIAERADLEAAVAKLRGGIGALNREGRERLLAAFDRVNGNFATLFTHLFGGGEARLVLVESDDPLEAGLEIMCQPPGKKLSTLSLLSGGEQTLTALALIFGVFLANPAPICVLDEVDAPLDDANVTRFCNLLDEMTRRTETRFLIITHNAITMARMDRLFGVTMAELGVSQLVSVDLKRAETMVA